MTTDEQHTPVTVAPAGPSVRVLQLTDTHLGSERGTTLLGMDTDHSLQAVIDLARSERPEVDLLLGTGDLANHGEPPAYVRLASYFEQFPCDSFWLPGNHDDRASMQAACGGRSQLGREIRTGNWRLLMLDSQIPGEVGGELGADELNWLDAALADAQSAGSHCLVLLHHHPVATGCAWLDEQQVIDADAFFSLLDRYDCVRAVLWGHVHQEMDLVRKGVRLLASPSTCVQFAPNSADFAAEERPPGYRWLELHPDGELDTGVSRVRSVRFNVNLEQGGYL